MGCRSAPRYGKQQQAYLHVEYSGIRPCCNSLSNGVPVDPCQPVAVFVLLVRYTFHIGDIERQLPAVDHLLQRLYVICHQENVHDRAVVCQSCLEHDLQVVDLSNLQKGTRASSSAKACLPALTLGPTFMRKVMHTRRDSRSSGTYCACVVSASGVSRNLDVRVQGADRPES